MGRLAVVCLLYLPLSSSAADDQKEVPKDLLPLQGAWKVVKAEGGLKGAPKEIPEEVRFTFAGNKLTIREGKGPAQEGTYEVDPRTDPAEIDLVDPKKVKIAGIYRLDKDGKLTICFVTKPGSPRPKKFGEADTVLVVLERAKDGGKEKPEAKKEIAKEQLPFQGAWKVVKVETGGKEPPAGQPKSMRFVFKGDSVTISEGNAPPQDGVYAVDPKKDPEEIDLITPRKEKILGIYKFDKTSTRLTITTILNPKAKRPTKFDEAETITFVMEKVKE